MKGKQALYLLDLKSFLRATLIFRRKKQKEVKPFYELTEMQKENLYDTCQEAITELNRLKED